MVCTGEQHTLGHVNTFFPDCRTGPSQQQTQQTITGLQQPEETVIKVEMDERFSSFSLEISQVYI